MSRFMIFGMIAVFGLGLAGLHYYFYRRLIKAPDLPVPVHIGAMVLLVVLGVGTPLTYVFVGHLDAGVSRYLVYPLYIWLGLLLWLGPLLLLLELIRAGVLGGARLAGRRGLLDDPKRRLFLNRAMAGVATGTTALLGTLAMIRGLGRLVIRKVEVTLPRLPAALDGFKIAQLTDLHVGPMRDGEWVAEVVKRTNGLKADLIAITGDLVEGPGQVRHLADEVAPLKGLKAPQGVFFVTGNHEIYSGVNRWTAHLRTLGVKVLRDQRVSVKKGDASFDLAGVDDYLRTGMKSQHKKGLSKALKGRDPKRALVLLAHRPKAVHEAARQGVGLVLSGHTHGGQVWPVHLFVQLDQPYVHGLHNHKGTQIYVSAGTGFWGPPMRLGSTAEITLITLRSPEKKGKAS